MGKEYTRTLTNVYGEKKQEKKQSKKQSKKKPPKKKSKKDISTSEEMRNILNSDTEIIYKSKNTNLQNNNLVPYDGDIPQQYNYMNQQQMMNQQPTNNTDVDVSMLQNFAPLQKEMFTNLSNFSKGPDIGMMSQSPDSGMMNNQFESVSQENMDLTNLNMLGTSKL